MKPNVSRISTGSKTNVTDNGSVKPISKIPKEKNMNATVSAINSTLVLKSIGQGNFLVIEDINLSRSVPGTWFSYENAIEMFNAYEHQDNSNKKILYTARKYQAKNEERGYPEKTGKAVAVKVDESNQIVTLPLHLNPDGKGWKEDYKYIISLETFLAYKQVLINEANMAALRKEHHSSNIIELN